MKLILSPRSALYAALAGSTCFVACSPEAYVRIESEPASEHCPRGGQRIELVTENETKRAYACHGEEPTNVEVAEDASAACANGGYVITSHVGDEAPVESRVCNGATNVIATAEPSGKNCEKGGIRLHVGDDDAFYVCHGKDSRTQKITVEQTSDECSGAGARLRVDASPTVSVCNDDSGHDVTLDAVPPGPDCLAGGISLQVDTSTPTLVCAGVDGEDGEDAAFTIEPPGVHCVHGGVAFQDDLGTNYACNGVDGDSVVVSAEPDGANCTSGGVKQQVGSAPATYVCRGFLTWALLTADTEAIPNSGYIGSSTTPVTLTLPASSTLHLGDVIQVVNSTSGRISIEPNATQSILAAPGVLTAGASTGRLVVPLWSSVELTYGEAGAFYVTSVEGAVEAP